MAARSSSKFVSSAKNFEMAMANTGRNILRLNSLVLEGRLALLCERGFAGKAEGKSSSSSGGGIPNVPGLSAKCLKVPTEPVGPGASKTAEYKNPEYFSYNDTSYFEAEVEMEKFRLPQPSAKK